MKKERGAITLFVLLAMMFFVMALISLFVVASNRTRLEKQITGQIQESYQEDANTVYNSYFGGEVVPIYTAEQLLKIGSEEKIRINEENGKIYTFSKDATYVLKNNLEFSEEEMGLTESWYPIGNQIEDGLITGRFEGNFLEIRVTELNGERYTYNRENEYKKIVKPLLDGFVVSEIQGENTIEDGLVVYEIPEEAIVDWENQTITINGQTTNLQETVNQYVWIPVEDINSMVMCSSNNEESVCNLVYNEQTEILKCENPDHTQTATDLVGRLYVTRETIYVKGGINYKTYLTNFHRRNQTYEVNSSYREPAVVTGNRGTDYDGDSNNLEIAGMPAGSTAEDFLTQLKSDFTEMATSVARNGGFYISRYEVGENGDSKKKQRVLTASNTDGNNYSAANTWYGLYKTLRDLDNNQQMIWGCQYDQVMKFLLPEEVQTGHSDRDLTTRAALSGENELDKMKNIYDLEGNFWEYTLEAVYNDNRICRGSYFNLTNTEEYSPANSRANSSSRVDEANFRFSSRSTVYM